MVGSWSVKININALMMSAGLVELTIGKYEEYKELSYRLEKGDSGYLEEILKAHLSMENPLASLRSRLVYVQYVCY